MSLLSFLSIGNVQVKAALRKGGLVIDVRTPGEFDQGKIPDSINIPVDIIAANAERIKKMNRPIIFCSASDSRSGTAVRIMKERGMKKVYNGGNWQTVLRIYNSL